MRNYFKLKVINSGYAVSIIEIIVSLIFLGFGIYNNGLFPLAAFRYFDIQLPLCIDVLLGVILAATLIRSHSESVIGKIKEQILICGCTNRDMFWLYAVYCLPIFFISLGMVLLFVPGHNHFMAELCSLAVLIAIMQSVFYYIARNKHSGPEILNKPYIRPKAKNSILDRILIHLWIRNRYISKTILKLVVISAAIYLKVLSMPEKYLTVFMLISIILIILSDDTYWKDETKLYGDLIKRGTSLDKFLFINYLASIIDDLPLIMIVSAFIQPIPLVYWIHFILFELYVDLVYIYSSKKFNYSNVLNGLLSSFLAFVGIVPVINIVFIFVMYEKNKHLWNKQEEF